jgi:2',3'-cyclic-nucleotide 2'-phosphodiesterase/3'-nucleotidase/5'-nucleotidase
MRMKKIFKFYLVATLAVTAFLCAGVQRMKPQEAMAAAKKETVNLRILGTTDLHGQLNSKDYEKGVDYNNGGLARLASLIQKTKSEVPAESVITLDAGDSLYDYTTEYIFSENQEELQPIFRAMKEIGYDAITLGNHDFDYGYEYILKQLNGSNLRAITVLSNVTDSKTGAYPFLENMMITRTLTTSEGNQVEVSIGIIGLTIPNLSPKTHSYVGILKAEDMVENAKKEAEKLKDMGADVIIALAHTGIGPENPEPNFKNVAYALTKIDEIDVVVCGHEHNQFPTTDYTSSYFTLPNVDKKTFLMNGKNVIMAGNRGSYLGVVDLTLTLYGNGNFRITDRKSELRPVKADTSTEMKELAGLYGSWEEKLLDYSTEVIAKLKEDELIHNFFGMLGDNAAIQVLNDAMIDYAQRFVLTTGTQYKGYPIVAASRYMSYGLKSPEDFINIKNSITEASLSSLQPYNNYVYIYTITGKQLKEWLEWPASAFETTSLSPKWTNATMSSLMSQTGLKSLLREDWLDDWSSFYIFDGIDYVINPSKEPRYDISGNKISTSNRVSNVTYNGAPVTDNMEFLIVTNKLTIPVAANKGVENQIALKGYTRTQSVLSKYLKEIAENGSIMPQVDENWKVNIPSSTEFIVKLPKYAGSLFEKTSWYKAYLTEANGYKYYKAAYPEEAKDTTPPHIIVTQAITSATATPYKVAVHATDRSGIKLVQYIKGDYDLDFFARSGGTKLDSDKTFTVPDNGTYTVYAEDMAGNKTVYKLVVSNFSDNLLSTPIVDTYTNRKTKIQGRGEPDTKIVFMAQTGIYEGKVGKNGTFSYALPAQPSGSIVTVYLKNEEKGLESPRVNVTVKRTGPNMPSVNQIMNTNGFITGSLEDDDASIIAKIGDTVYVPKNGGKELFEKNTEIYNPSYKVVETDYEVGGSGYFRLALPPQMAGTQVTLYNIDHVSRNSRAYTTTVAEVGPEAPVVYEISNIERSLSGYVPTSSKKIYQVDITIKGTNYTVMTDQSGKFNLSFQEQLTAGETITVTASDTKNGAKRNSYTAAIKVRDIEEFVKTDRNSLTLNRITDKSTIISGNYEEAGTVYVAVANTSDNQFTNTLYTLEADENGRFKYYLPESLEEGNTVYAMVRFTDGRILTANKLTVSAGIPDMPSLVKKITNADNSVQVIAKKNCEITLKIGANTYTATSYQDDKQNNRYIYSFEIERAMSGSEVKVTAKNEMGVSDVFSSSVVKAAPDRPVVNAVKAGAKKLTGSVELLDYTGAEETESLTLEVPKRFQDAPEKVAKTQTRVVAQIGNRLYEGTITNKGKFTIEIPAQKAGTEILVWGVNKAGRGPFTKVKVKAK